jgi:hypothetical protein
MAASEREVEAGQDGVRAPYEPPQIIKKRPVSRVTLFSSGGATGSSGTTGLTAT